MSDAIRQYVTVGIGAEIFALDVAQVREVLDLCPFTRVPNMPDFVRGMIQVRGHGVPVVDMRQKFGLPPVEPFRYSSAVCRPRWTSRGGRRLQNSRSASDVARSPIVDLKHATARPITPGFSNSSYRRIMK